jgi:hypothetical protein
VVPEDAAAQRGGTGYHPLAIAKRYGTLDRISGGRLVLADEMEGSGR